MYRVSTKTLLDFKYLWNQNLIEYFYKYGSADKLTADTLTADTLTADTLTADTLTADTLTADTLTADTLTQEIWCNVYATLATNFVRIFQ